MAFQFNPFTGNLDNTSETTGVVTPPATESVAGKIEIATQAETDAGVDDTRAITPAKLANAPLQAAGNATEVQYNSNGTLAGSSNLTFDGSTLTSSTAGAASTPAVNLDGTWFSGGTAETTKPQLLIEPDGTTSTAWDTDGTGIGVNAASGFAGNLLDLQVDGTSRTQVLADGQLALASTNPYSDIRAGNNANTGIKLIQTGGRLTYNSFTHLSWDNGLIGVVNLGFGPVPSNSSISRDVILERDAANTFAQRRGTNAQTYRLYNTYTDASNYERGMLEWNADILLIGTQAAGTGTARELKLQTGGTDALAIDTSQNVTIGAGDLILDDGGSFDTTIQSVTATANRVISFPDATGTVALVSGSNNQIQYNSSGSLAGSANLTFDGSTFDVSTNGAASTPPSTITGTWFSGGTAETTKPQLLIEPDGTTSTAWDTDGTGIGVNAASGFAGNLLDLQVDGTSQLEVSAVGGVYTPRSALDGGTTAGYFFDSPGNMIGFRADSNNHIGVFTRGPQTFSSIMFGGPSRPIFKLASTFSIAWGSNEVATQVNEDLALSRDSAGVVKVTDGSTGTGYLKLIPTTVGGLTAAATVGAGTRAFVTDSTNTLSSHHGQVVVGGGSDFVPVFSDGTNWIVG